MWKDENLFRERKKSFFASKWKIMCVCVFVETAAWRSLIWIRRIRGPFLHFCLLRKGRQPTMRMKNIRKFYLETTCLRCCLFCVYLFIFSVRGFRWWKQKKNPVAWNFMVNTSHHVEFASFNINEFNIYILKKIMVWSSLKPFSKKLSMMNTCDNV